MKFPPITTARLEYVPSFRSYLLFLLVPAPSLSLALSFSLFLCLRFFALSFFFFKLRSSIVYHARKPSHTNGHGPGRMRRNVFESIPFASYFTSHRRKDESTSSTWKARDANSGQMFSKTVKIRLSACKNSIRDYTRTSQWKFKVGMYFLFRAILEKYENIRKSRDS